MDKPMFLINEREYPIPTVDTFTIDECRIFHEWTGIHVEDLDDTPANSQMIAAVMQVAFMRGNPGIKEQTARDMVGASNFAEAMARFNKAAVEDDADPPEPKPSEPVPNDSLGNEDSPPRSSGTGSTKHLDTAASTAETGGSPRSEPSATFRNLTSVG